MMRKRFGVGISVLTVLVGAAAPASATQADECEFRQEHEAEIAVDSGTLLRIIAGSGSLKVVGSAGRSSISMTATACTSEEWMLEGLEVTVSERNSDVVFETVHPDHHGSNQRGRNHYARLDLRLEVPLGMAAIVRDGSGGIEITGLGPLGVKDGSGSLYIRDISGDLLVEDGSGGVEISQVEGSVEVEDGSGEVSIEDVTGSVFLADGSGSVEVRGVSMDVRVSEMGSGGLRVSDVGGDFVVRDGRNELISHSNVEGRVDIPESKKRRRRRGGGR